MDNEIWKPHPIYTNYAISNLGRVKNINQASSGLQVCIGISVQFRKSDSISYHNPSISVDLKIVINYQLHFQPHLCKV